MTHNDNTITNGNKNTDNNSKTNKATRKTVVVFSSRHFFSSPTVLAATCPCVRFRRSCRARPWPGTPLHSHSGGGTRIDADSVPPSTSNTLPVTQDDASEAKR